MSLLKEGSTPSWEALPTLCGAGSFLLSSIDVQVESQIVEASEATLLLSMMMRLDMSVVREILAHKEWPDARRSYGGIVLSTVAYEVGYESVSQFTRE
jgi:hypothetical protein